MITVEQKPLDLTPSNVSHAYTFTSTFSGNTDFRYVIDLWVDTMTPTPSKITRILVSPNTYGKGIVEVGKIIESLVEGNARSSENQYTSSATSDTSVYGIISNVSGITNSNGWNVTEYEHRYHVRDYRLMVGEQYTSGGTTVIDIASSPLSATSGFYAQLTQKVAGYAGNPNSVEWFGAGAYNIGGNAIQGVNIYHRTFGGSLVYSANTSTIDGYYTPSSAPSSDDLLDITERETGIIYKYQWTVEPPVINGWRFLEIEYPAGYDYSPPPIITWPGTSLNEGTYLPNYPNNGYWTDTIPTSNSEFYEVKAYRMSGTTIDEENPSRFLTTAGPELYSFSDPILGNVVRGRRRRHHPQCPILVGNFYGYISGSYDLLFNNDLDSYYIVEGPDKYGDYTTFTELSNSSISTGNTVTDKMIRYLNNIRPDLAGGKIAIWAGNTGEIGQWDAGGYSELLEYYIEDEDCLSDPVHVLFLNRQGIWDTYTLDKKALVTKSIDRKTYGKGGVRDLPHYSILSTDRRKVVYDQNITEVMNVSTWYLTDNDKVILEDLFMSPEVYIIKEHDWTGKQEKTYNPYLLPVNVITGSLTEFKNRYNKTFQYTFDLEYTPINKYKTQG